MTKYILASASPRRVEILGHLGFEFTVEPSDAEDKLKKDFNKLPPKEKVEELSFIKAADVAESLILTKETEEGDAYIVIGADTVVAVDDEILIESFLKGTEISIGVIKYRGAIKVLPMTEIVSENDFFDYDAKYNGKSQEITPARISEEMTAKINALAERVYRLLKMEGFSRSEFIIVGDTPYLLEMNTTPGLSEASLLPQQAKVAGISLADLFESEIERVLNTK